MQVSASVSDVKFEAQVRVVMKPLVGFKPIVGGIQVSFLQKPHLDFNLGGVASIVEKLPFLKRRIKDTIHEQVACENMKAFDHLVINDH